MVYYDVNQNCNKFVSYIESKSFFHFGKKFEIVTTGKNTLENIPFKGTRHRFVQGLESGTCKKCSIVMEPIAKFLILLL